MVSHPGTIVVAVGGNALSPPGERATIFDQFRHTRESLGVVVELAELGWRIVLVHGNGPQVGHELTRNEVAADLVEPLPLGVLVASTAGWIGYMIQQSLQNALARAGSPREVLTVITQTVVSREDPRLAAPTKPVGNVLTEERAERLRARGATVRRDRRGVLRRMAPSPLPLAIVEADAVGRLVEEGKIVVASGGGGTPVYRDDRGNWEGVDAVVDKDLTAAILGRAVGADTMLILTDVDAVYRNWGRDDAAPIPRLRLVEAESMLRDGSVGTGTMAPKLEAAMTFVREGGTRAVIAHLARGLEALRGDVGTTIMGETTG